MYGEGIYAKGSKVHLLGSTFCFNLAGGSIYSENTTVIFTVNDLFVSNSAGAYGGAVCLHASTLNFSSTSTTMIQRTFYSTNIQITFEGNSAQEAGCALYGGLVDNCKLKYSFPTLITTAIIFDRTFRTFSFMQNLSDFLAVSSFPFKLCPCQNNYPDCETSVVNHQIYPGEKITLPVVAVGQKNGTALAVIQNYVQSDKLGELQES